jgi:D-glycero-beta-D-manno-heptose-7-phosphate kinase
MSKKENIDMFKDVKIAVIGDIGLDVYRFGKATRLCPEAPVPIFEEEHVKQVPGLAANVAQNIVALGGKAEIFSVVGTNTELLNIVEAPTITTQDVSRKSTIKTRFMVGNHFLLRQDEESVEPLNKEIEELFIFSIKDSLSKNKFDAIILSDYAKGVLTTKVCREIIENYGNKIPIIVDPKPRGDYKKYSGVTVITPNLKEIGELKLLSESSNLDNLCSELKISNIVLTQGEKGLLVYNKEKNKETIIGAIERKVYDVCGAGDTVVATLAMGLASGMDIVKASKIANVAASIVVGKLGTSTVSNIELQEELNKI